MKKALIAGAASVALAALPMASSFAVLQQTDTLKLTIADTCSLAYGDTAHSADTTIIAGGAWGDGSSETSVLNTYYGTVVNGQSYADFATTNFKVTCNNQGGYQVTITPSGFTATGVTETWAYEPTVNGTFAEGSTSKWTIKSTHAGQTLGATGEGANNALVAKTTSSLPTSGEPFSVKYSARVSSSQPAGTYTATAQYDMSKL